jgi:hypothetical protein
MTKERKDELLALLLEYIYAATTASERDITFEAIGISKEEIKELNLF